MKRLFRSTWFVVVALAAVVGFTPSNAAAQAILSGRVLGDQGQPIAGAGIQVAELNVAVATDQSGNFSITVPAARLSGQTVILRARAIGFKPQTRNVTLTQGRQTITFTLERDVAQLSEVVVTGVATATEQVKLPFTVARLDTAAMPVTGTNPITQLQGKIPGATVVSASGRPGAAPSVILRGPVSLNATGRTQGPLYLLDGVPLLGGLPDINAADIENVEVVKGAAAASLYGARAGAGVINITTKTGKNSSEGIRFGVRTEIGAGDVERRFPLATRTALFLDPSGQYFCTREVVGGSPCARYIDWDREVLRINNSGEDFSGSAQTFAGETSLAAAPDYNQLTGQFLTTPWPRMRDPISQLITPSAFANTNIDMRGRLNNTGVYASFGNLVQQGAVQFMGGFVRNSARVNIDQRFGDKISGNINTFYSQSTDHGAQLDDEGAGSASPFFTITRAPAMADMEARDALGRIIVRHNPLLQGLQNFNPMYATHYNKRADRQTRFVGGTTVRYTPMTWLNLDGNFGYDRSVGSYLQMRDRGWRTVSSNPVAASGFFGSGDFDDMQITSSLSASATKTLFGDLNTTLSTRYTYGEQTLTSMDLSGTDIVLAGLETASATTANKAVGSARNDIRDIGFFTGLDLDWKDRYILTGLIRRDGSSLFGAGNRWATFGRVAGAWIASREPWWPAPEALSLVKLRASQGTTGQRPRFSAQYETYTIGTGGTLNPAQLGNRNLRPEVNKEIEVGADLEFFSRIGANISYARSVINDQILPVTKPAASGFASQWQNAGELTNKTWEATLTVPIVTRGNFNWSSRLIWDKTRSVITRLDVPEFTGDIVAGNTFTVFKFRKGEEIGTMYGAAFARDCSHLPANFQSQCSMNSSDLNAAFRPNSDGWIAWFGQGNQITEGITRNLWRSQLPLGQGPWGNRTNWGMPIARRDSTLNIGNYALGSGLPKYHIGLSNTIDFGRFNLYGLLDAARGQKLFNIQRAWSLADLQVGEADQNGVSVENAKPVGYYWRQGPSQAPTAGSTAGVGGFYDALGPNNYNVEDGSYVKLREIALNYRLGAIGGSGDWKVGVIGRNVKTWTDFRGFDPESGNTSGPLGSAALTGVAGYRYPKMRTYTVQLSTSF